MEAYNWELCQDRHRKIEKMEAEMWTRLKAVENRWFLLMLALVANMGGVIALLIKG